MSDLSRKKSPLFFMSPMRTGFTLIEVLVSLAIVAVLSTVVVVTLNPAELMKQARDSNRISDLNTVNTALSTYAADVVGATVGASSTVYVSLPSNSSDCSDLGLPALPSGWVYKCATRENLTKIDGTGWIPANLQRISFGNPLEKLPIDQKNTVSGGLYYTFVTTGSWWELTAILESDKYGPRMVVDGGASPNAFEQGTNLTLTPAESLDRGIPPSVNTPTIASISPTSTYAGDPQFTLTVDGANFTTSSVVRWSGTDKTTSFVSDTQLTATILAADISATGTVAVTVYDPVNGTSGSSNFAIGERTQFIAGSWTTDSAGGAIQGTGSSIVEVAGNLYVLVGGTGFQKYDPVAKTWSNLTSVPASVGSGGSMTGYGSDEIYVFIGNSTAGFYKYTISTNSWTALASAPAAVGNGGSLSYPGSGDYIYAFRANNSFWRYSISNDSWGESGTAQGYGSFIAEANGKFYVMFGNSGTVFKEYNPTTKLWTALAAAPATISSGAAITRYDSDTFYVFTGDDTTGFYKYTISTDSWTTLAVAPGTVRNGGSLSYPGTGDYIYAFRGNSTSAFWRYSISNNSWGESGTAQGYGAVIAEANGKSYVMFGNSGTVFKEYNPATKAWTTLAATPAAVSNGAAIVRYDSDNFYAFTGNGTTGFYKYNITTNSWTTLATTTAATGTGGSLSYPGSGDYIYASRGSNTNTFWKYSISGDSWSSAANAPGSIGAGGSLISLSSTTVYAMQGNIGSGFWLYNISTGTWASKASTPEAVNGGGPLLTTDGSYIYALRGTGTATFWKYDPIENSWSSLANAPANIATNSFLTYGGLAYSSSLSKIFAITGRSDGIAGSILEYDVASNLWSFGPYTSAIVGAGGSLTSLNSNKLYGWQGGGGSVFWEYDIPTGVWTTKASSPSTVNGGGSLISDGTYVYAVRGTGTVTLWKYDPVGNSWSSLANAPTTIATNSAASYAGIAYSALLNKMLAITGKSDGVSCSILEYDPVVDAWPKPCYIPATVGAGGSLTSLNSNKLYGWQGGGGSVFWEYDIPTGVWTTKASSPSTVNGGGSLLTSDGTSIYVFRGTGFATFWSYDPVGNLWSALADAPGTIASNSSLTKGGIVYSQVSNAIFGITGKSGVIYKNSQ